MFDVDKIIFTFFLKNSEKMHNSYAPMTQCIFMVLPMRNKIVNNSCMNGVLSVYHGKLSEHASRNS